MWCIKVVDKKLYLPKTPYNEEEQRTTYLTNKPHRIARYKFKKVATNRLNEVGHFYNDVLEVSEID